MRVDRDREADSQPDRASDQRASAIARGYFWASRIFTVSLEMVCPGLLGLWADSRLGISPALTVLGFAAGLVLGIWHLLSMVKAKSSDE